jgi:uncharacterized protein YbcI
MKTQGEIEAAVCKAFSRFEQEHVGRGPKDTRAYLIEDLLVVRLTGVLTPAEVKLVKSASPEKGKDLVKESRAHLMESSELTLEALIEEATGVGVVSMHNDISTVTGEKIILFTLTESPTVREAKKR